MVRSIGADEVIDYTQDDFTQNGQHYDAMLDLVGTRSLSDCRRTLTPRGTYVLVGVRNMGRWFGLGRQSKALAQSLLVPQRMRVFVVRHTADDLAVLKELVEASREGHARHRQALHLESGPRSSPIPGGRPPPGKDCHRRVKRVARPDHGSRPPTQPP